jgi:all-trans-retinol 13,14-reductase
MSSPTTNTHPSTDHHYDAIIIGSGIGGLSTGSILAQMANKRVLILERHFTAGGFTHAFSRKGIYHWDVGLHYVGQMGPNDNGRPFFDYITQKGVQWTRMNDPFEMFVYPDFRFGVHGQKERYLNDLIERFPTEASALKRYFKDIDRATKWPVLNEMANQMPAWLGYTLKWVNNHLPYGRNALTTTGDYLAERFQDPQLKAVLASQWGDYGLPPAESAFLIHSTIAKHYLDGGYYPVGGGATIAQSVEKVLKQYGGEIKVRQKVEEILRDNSGRANGVRVSVDKGNEKHEQVIYHAPIIISDAGAYTTYHDLLPAAVAPELRKAIADVEPASSSVGLYLGLKASPATLGIQGENYWIYSSYDHDAMYQNGIDALEGKPHFLYLSFPSVKDPEAKGHTAELLTFAPYAAFEHWKNNKWRHRGEDYNQLKETIAHGMIQFVEERIPGFAGLVDYHEVSTPITIEQFTGHRAGNIYGIPPRLDRYKIEGLGVKTPVSNLYLTGTDALGHGIMGAMMSGVLCAGVVLGGVRGIGRVFGTVQRSAKAKN